MEINFQRKYLKIHRNPNPKYRKEISVEVLILKRYKARGRDFVLITPTAGGGELEVEERCLYDTI